jgi:hypothetical protein
MSSTFEKKLAERDARIAKEAAANSHPEDLIPTIPKHVGQESLQLDGILGSLTIDRAYEKWCNKSPVPRRGSQTEGLKVSCPNPAHPDKHPSAWLNLDKGLWTCGACETGGDLYDIAAWHFGYTVPGYKKTHFRELREKMAADLGFSKRTSGGATYYSRGSTDVDNPVDSGTDKVETPEPAVDLENQNTEESLETGHTNPDNTGPTPAKTDKTTSGDPPLASVTPIKPPEYADEDLYPFPPIKWREIVSRDTFLWKWMEITTQDDVPEEYHFWNGLIAISMAIGRDVTLYDRLPVFGNLFVCIVGHSGDGKSQSRYHLNEILGRCLPYKHVEANSKGTRRIATPGSAEVLIHQFSKPIVDPVDPKKVAYYAGIRGLVDFNELSAFTGRAARTGNVLKPVLMQFFDNDRIITTASMTHGTKEAHDSYASITTTTQPKAFRDLMHKSDIDSGFLNRWMFVGGVLKKRVAIGGVMINTKPCDKYLNEIFAWSGAGRQLSWDEDAAEAFSEFYHKIVEPAKRKDDTGLLVRIDLTLKKLALLLTVNQRQKTVSLETVQHLVPLYQYLIECYGLSSDAIGNTLHSEIRTNVLRVVRRMTDKSSGRGCTMRELNRNLASKKYPMDHLLKVLKFMTELGELEQETTQGQRGPATVRYHYVD